MMLIVPTDVANTIIYSIIRDKHLVSCLELNLIIPILCLVNLLLIIKNYFRNRMKIIECLIIKTTRYEIIIIIIAEFV
jgi:hypothetical protein